jgi:hypothetical protein
MCFPLRFITYLHVLIVVIVLALVGPEKRNQDPILDAANGVEREKDDGVETGPDIRQKTGISHVQTAELM